MKSVIIIIIIVYLHHSWDMEYIPTQSKKHR